ncbi:DEAD/DEAH box helicase [Kaistia geumhonensis]|uniref:ATP-dependent RNA helicase RhlE n=1 Tax=Kaistia geumhonensis TaxID=410839 RepID=A0ABU0M7C9_9HYPH|nr:DEAD/DEAH box helicase [Kaistia geumhonensis]MDQ0516877.1 ATP-dependent RNA helicase RhlE [Kaistia geumhonensis]
MNQSKNFADLALAEPLLRALGAAGLVTPTPIQAEAIPALLEGRDMLGIAQTGTGKTAAFGLPLLQHLARRAEGLQPKSVRALILAPTRELAMQIDEELRKFGRFLGIRHALVFGGVGHTPQIRALEKGVDILVATPGRLLDHLDSGVVKLDRVQYLVLDEADRMLDMGFVRDVMKIVGRLPEERQSLLFSATMPAEVAQLSKRILKDPLRVEVTPEVVTVERIDQRLYHVPAGEKRGFLVDLLSDETMRRVIVFTRTKHGADRVAQHLSKARIETLALHGNKSQGARQKALAGFKDGSLRVLVATDIAARGIDVSDVTHVVNFDLPDEPEAYVHRIGRTARAGREGVAYSLFDAGESQRLKAIERLIRRPIPEVATRYKLHAPSSRPVADSDRGADLQREGRPMPQKSKKNRWRSQQRRRAA